MSNLITDLGASYVREFYRGAVFLHEDTICMIDTCTESGARCYTMSLDTSAEREEWGTKIVPMDFFKNFSSMAWPKLGYRNFSHPKIGNTVAFITSHRSVLRGLRDENINSAELPVMQCLDVSSLDHHRRNSGAYRWKVIFNPTWYNFSDGIKKIRLGEITGFAMNEDIAIGLSVDQAAGRFCDIYFKEKVVGCITEKGQVEITNKVIKRGHMKSILTLLEGN